MQPNLNDYLTVIMRGTITLRDFKVPDQTTNIFKNFCTKHSMPFTKPQKNEYPTSQYATTCDTLSLLNKFSQSNLLLLNASLRDTPLL